MPPLPSSAISALKQHPTVRKLGLEVLKHIKAKPYERPNMEFEWDVWVGISSFHSADGRQIGENNTGPYPYHEAIETDHKVFKFDDSRQGMPCNMTALRSILPQWNDTLQMATLLRQRYIQKRGLQSNRFNLLDAYLYSKLGAALPSYLARRSQSPLADGKLPVLETAFFTLGVGPFMVMRALMEQGDLQCLDPLPQSADVWYAMADRSGSLITPKGYACAGSPKLIREFLDVTMNGTYTGAMDSPHVERMLKELKDFDAFYDYTRCASTLELIVKLFHALVLQNLMALAADSRAATPALAPQLRALIEAFILQHAGFPIEDVKARTDFNRRPEILVALLQNLGADALLDQLHSGHLQVAPPESSNAQQVAQRLRSSVTILGAACADYLQQAHRHLGRPGWGRIEASDIATRVFGKDLDSLLHQLDTP